MLRPGVELDMVYIVAELLQLQFKRDLVSGLLVLESSLM